MNMKLSQLANEVIINIKNSERPLTPLQLTELSILTKHCRRINAVLMQLEDADIIKLIKTTSNIASYECYYEMKDTYAQF